MHTLVIQAGFCPVLQLKQFLSMTLLILRRHFIIQYRKQSLPSLNLQLSLRLGNANQTRTGGRRGSCYRCRHQQRTSIKVSFPHLDLASAFCHGTSSITNNLETDSLSWRCRTVPRWLSSKTSTPALCHRHHNQHHGSADFIARREGDSYRCRGPRSRPSTVASQLGADRPSGIAPAL